ncbi:metal-dependent hydrolase [Fulvivirgaceae bacterium BMA12]|uniref:Metal-dependent hydrolase n=1 Tax=Agaribacillus aureus TaxID=3051825 RepID=A0ABT8LJX3_9BACT|nr:metal-dependent hydrolase [Fulvivirgaceae bacterium BMA12]
MDSLTQIVLGAAVGEATLGKKAGNKALVWGAIGGTIPDLDVILNAFLDPVQAVLAHRAFSHSIFFAILVSPILGWLLKKIYRHDDLTIKDWTKLFFWTIFTHPLLDIFTNYGTGLFYPLWEERIALNTIFVVDPAYTLPLLVAFIVTFFFKRNDKRRRWLNWAALGLSSLYLGITVINKININREVRNHLARNSIPYQRFATIPAPLNNILWSVIIQTEDGFWVGYRSILETNHKFSLRFIPQQEELLNSIYDEPQIQKLIFFSKGYYALVKADKEIVFNDLRFSTVKGWFDLKAGYVFSFYISGKKRPLLIKRKLPAEEITKEDLKILWQRITNY